MLHLAGVAPGEGPSLHHPQEDGDTQGDVEEPEEHQHHLGASGAGHLVTTG